MRYVARYPAGAIANPKPQPRKAIEFAERTQHHDGQIHAQLDGADLGLDVRKGFIDDQPSAAIPQQRSGTRQCGASRHAAIGIVGIDDHRVADVFGKRIETGNRHHLMTGQTPGQRMFVVGRLHDRDRSFAANCGSHWISDWVPGAATTPASAGTA